MESKLIDRFLSTGYGSGDGFGSGSGSGFGFGSGDGSGSGSGDGLKEFCGKPIHYIDGVPTIINIVRGNVAKGHILQVSLSLTPCYIAKSDGYFAHGDTLREAMEALAEKLFEDMSEDERIDAFIQAHDYDKSYPNTDFFKWHNKLTGSCKAGREAFMQDHNIDMAASMTIAEFICLTKDSYNGEVIQRLEDRYRS